MVLLMKCGSWSKIVGAGWKLWDFLSTVLCDAGVVQKRCPLSSLLLPPPFLVPHFNPSATQPLFSLIASSSPQLHPLHVVAESVEFSESVGASLSPFIQPYPRHPRDLAPVHFLHLTT
eukprot:TRINITY_DN4928_c0_g3_i1.p2 TRINITY_DN4928_c0_g3~~TRINITY_DN4928_c0_g3_i1.p2  ORF type:complete len:118 (+),score=13.99 TRINITY_DN4928_c0_g3_i1:421-774(+)